MLLDVEHIFLIKLEIVLSVIVQVTGLSDYHSRHLVSDKLLSSAEHRECSESGQTLSLDKFDQIEFFRNRHISLLNHLRVLFLTSTPKDCETNTLF